MFAHTLTRTADQITIANAEQGREITINEYTWQRQLETEDNYSPDSSDEDKQQAAMESLLDMHAPMDDDEMDDLDY